MHLHSFSIILLGTQTEIHIYVQILIPRLGGIMEPNFIIRDNFPRGAY